mgnify:CR=1 FL=1
MTRKDYIEIAKVLKNAKEEVLQDQGRIGTIRQIALDLCGVLKQDNQRFNKDKFLEACGL